MLESSSKTIGEYSYTVRQLDAIRGTKVMVRLAKALGPLLSAGDSAALSKAFEALNETDVEYLCTTFAATTTVQLADGKAPQLDKVFAMHFAGKYTDMIKWFLFCLEVNFSGFFDGKKLSELDIGAMTAGTK